MSGAKIVLVAAGSLGDLHPFVALAHALKARGLAPVLATNDYYREYLATEGVAFAPVRPDFEEMLRRLGQDMHGVAREMTRDDDYLFHKMIFPAMREACESLHGVCADAALVVGHASVGFAARIAADRLGLPFVGVALSPLLFHSIHAPPAGTRIPYALTPGGPFARGWNSAVRKFFEIAIPVWAAPYHRLRREFGLRRLRGGDAFSFSDGAAAMIGLYSPLLAPKQPDHPDNLSVVGFAFHDRHKDDGAAVIESLQAFLAAGTPPIVFTLGSFFARDQIAHYRAGVEAARRLGRRALLLVNQDDLDEALTLAANDVFVAAYVPHSRVFPHAAVIAHHGGIGTTGQALRAGRPQLVTPLMGDQTDNGARLARLGVARALKKAEPNADLLTRELGALLNEESYARRAWEIAPLVASEDGARVAAEIIEALCCETEKEMTG